MFYLKPSIRENYKKSIIDIRKINMAMIINVQVIIILKKWVKFCRKKYKKKDELKKLERKQIGL